jgi:uncharacterized protein with HEPN domain
MPSRSDGYLLDMLLACRSIRDFTSGQTEQSFCRDRLRIRAVEREIEILGEAARNLDEKTRQLTYFHGEAFRLLYLWREWTFLKL